MCLRPILIRNPNYLSRDTAHQTKLEHHFAEHMSPLSVLKDTTNPYMYVPCGTCPVCLMVKQNYLVQRAQIMSMTHYAYFGTLTYNNKHLRSLDLNGYKHSYAEPRDFALMIKRLRKQEAFGDRDIKYILCTEYGGKKHRPHMHFVLFVEKKDRDREVTPLNLEKKYWKMIKDEWRICVRPGRFPLYEPLFDYRRYRGNRNYDFHYVNPKMKGAKEGENDVMFYVTKYVLKYDNWFRKKQQALRLNLEDKDYKEAMSHLKPRVQVSKHFGDSDKGREYFRVCVDKSKSAESEFIRFYNRITGKSFPMSPYLRKKFMTLDDAFYFLEHRTDRVNDYDSATSQADFEANIDDAKNKNSMAKYEKMLRDIEARNHNEFIGDELELPEDMVSTLPDNLDQMYHDRFDWKPTAPSTEEFEDDNVAYIDQLFGNYKPYGQKDFNPFEQFEQ